MNTISVQDDAELNNQVNTWLHLALKNIGAHNKIVQLPAGNTPLSLYKSWEATPPEFLNDILFQQVDDVLTGPKSGCFRKFFEENLPSFQNQFLPLASAPITPGIAILGVGPNGHLAFHEPDISLSLNYGCVRLSASTCDGLGITEPTWGITYGAAHFLKCPALLIIAKGKNKKTILDKALTETSPSSPLSFILKSHRNCTLIIEQPLL